MRPVPSMSSRAARARSCTRSRLRSHGVRTRSKRSARRARAELARITAFAGSGGEWAALAGHHEQLVARIQSGGDPKPALRELGALVDANPRYPRAALAMLVLARGWERDGDVDAAREWMRRAERSVSAAGRALVLAEAARLAVR